MIRSNNNYNRNKDTKRNIKHIIKALALGTAVTGTVLVGMLSGLAGGSAAASTNAAGDLDPTFGTGGKLVTDFGSNNDAAHAMLVQPDGKIVAAGESWHFAPSSNENRPRFTLARYNSNGALDATFGSGGKVVTQMIDDDQDYSVAHAVVRQPDGKLVVAGTASNPQAGKSTFALARYNSNGTLDAGFGSGGRVLTAVQSNVGFSDKDDAEGVALQPDGKIVVVGSTGEVGAQDFAVVRYNPDGSLDSNFGNAGIVTADAGHDDVGSAVAIQTDGKIVVAGRVELGSRDNDFAVLRLNADGSVDTAFSDGGMAPTDFDGGYDWATSVLVRPDGKIVAGGYASLMLPEECNPGIPCERFGFALAQYNTDGTLDTSFGQGGKVASDFGATANGKSLVRLADGRLALAGWVYSGDFAVALYNANGSPETSFGNNGWVRTNFAPSTDGSDHAEALAVQADGKLVVAGEAAVDGQNANSDFGLARYLMAGSGMPATATPTKTAPATATGVRTASATAALPSATPTHHPVGSTATAMATAASASATPTHRPTNPTATPTASTPPGDCNISYSDVLPGSTFYTYVQCLSCRKIISGYGDGTFRPNAQVTRGQLSKIVSNAAGFNDPVTGQTFSDVTSGQPYYTFIERMARRGIIGGYSDGTFRPNATATRGQIAKIVSNAAGFSEPVSGQTFSDVAPGSPFYEYVERMARRSILGGYADGTFRPNAEATRGQVAKIVGNAFFPNCKLRAPDASR